MKKELTFPETPIFQTIRKKSQIISIILTLVFLNMCTGCSYYKAVTMETNSDSFADKYNSIDKPNRYLIIHSGNLIWHLNNLAVNRDDKTITGNLMPVEDSHLLYPLKEKRKSKRYEKSKSPDKALEIHFYTDEVINPNTSSLITIPFSAIKEIKVHEPDKTRSAFSIVGLSLSGLLVVLLIVGAIATANWDFGDWEYNPPQ